MKLRNALFFVLLCVVSGVTTDTSAQVDDSCRLSSLNSMLKLGQLLTLEPKAANPMRLSFQAVDPRACTIQAASSAGEGRTYAVEDLSRISYVKKGRLSPVTMAFAAVGGAALGAAIGSFVDPAESLPSDYVGEDEQKGPVAGAIAGGVVGLAAGTIIPLVLKRTYVIEF